MEYTDVHRPVNAISDSPSGLRMSRPELLAATRWPAPRLLAVARAAEGGGLVVLTTADRAGQAKLDACSITRSGRGFVAARR